MQSRIREFQERLSKSYAPHGEQVQRKLILQPGESGVTGVVKGKPTIAFQNLHNRISDNEIQGRHAILHNEFL